MESAIAAGGATPITVLTGFLGAGKTTLLNGLLNGTQSQSVGVLVNDFGSVNIDAELVVGVDGGAISLANGCVCCEIRDDLVESVLRLLERPEAVDCIVLEASGVADPGGIFMTFTDPALRDRIRLDSVTCVVDAEQFFAHPEYPALLELKMRQVGFADMVILNKVHVAGTEQVGRVRLWLDQHFNRLRVVETDFCDVPRDVLMSTETCGLADHDVPPPGWSRRVGDQEQRRSDDEGHQHDPAFAFQRWSGETDPPISLGLLRDQLRALPGSIYRIKGIVHALEEPERRVIVQVVGRRVDFAIHEPWGESRRSTRLVAIGAADGTDLSCLDSMLVDCTTAGQTHR